MPVAEPIASPPPGPPGSGPADPRPPRPVLVRATALVATAAVVAALVGLGLLLVPVRTPSTECGTSLTYLLDGRLDRPIDPADPPPGVTAAEAEAGNAAPCHPRVVDRARPAAYLILGGSLVAVLALAAEVLARNTARRSRRLGGPPSDH